MGWLSWIIQEGPKSNHRCPCKGRQEDLRFTHRRCEDGDRDWSDVAISHRMLTASRSCFLGLLTNYHKLGNLKQQDFIVSQFWMPEVLHLGGTLPCLCQLLVLLAILDVPWLCSGITPVSTSVVTWPFSLCVCPNLPSYKDTSYWIMTSF